ncbi:MAG: 3-keto-5-aminohexanoate cleavage protein, partial [Pseudoflavonifractor sp.]
QLAERYDFVKPILFAIVLGHEGAMPRNNAALSTMIAGVYENFPNRDDVLWGITEAHREDFSLIQTALDLGASTVRIGFEDSNYLRPGVQVDNNAAMIGELAGLIRRRGMDTMTPTEAREMLHIPP